MEGREYSSTGNVYPDQHIKSSSDDEDEYKDLLDTREETYVIQVPKDQIYRVPPPENAIIAEQRRNVVPKTKTTNCMLLSFLVVTLVITLIFGITLTVVNKADPTFRIHGIHVTTRGKGKDKQHEFEFTLKSKNANGHTTISFQKGGKASLSFRDKRLAICRFPTSEQDINSLDYIKLNLVSGSGKTLPNVIQKSINGTYHTSIKLSLEFKVPLRFKVRVFPVKSKSLSIICNVKVKRLTNQASILAQDCDYSTS